MSLLHCFPCCRLVYNKSARSDPWLGWSSGAGRGKAVLRFMTLQRVQLCPCVDHSQVVGRSRCCSIAATCFPKRSTHISLCFISLNPSSTTHYFCNRRSPLAWLTCLPPMAKQLQQPACACSAPILLWMHASYLAPNELCARVTQPKKHACSRGCGGRGHMLRRLQQR